MLFKEIGNCKSETANLSGIEIRTSVRLNENKRNIKFRRAIKLFHALNIRNQRSVHYNCDRIDARGVAYQNVFGIKGISIVSTHRHERNEVLKPFILGEECNSMLIRKLCQQRFGNAVH